KEDGLKLCDFKKPEKPVLLVMGGSLGAVHINDAIRKNLKSLVKKFNIIHLCGKGNLDETIENDSYVQFEYVNEELKDIFAAADIVVSRAGANAICELLVLAKPALLIPLSAEASRGDQILNAASFKKQGFADMLEEQDMTDEILLTKINELYECREDYIDKMKDSRMNNSTEKIMSLIKATVKDR
nr:UDP-N-acetylglucosamine--N-acetylmuramyl-(pentapeptide) pyrophosphoryl-undecaprenol N-acetylglucosamine transferase [Lachnospiraceae bacterium]